MNYFQFKFFFSFFNIFVNLKVLCADVRGNLLVVATTDRAVKTFDLATMAGGQPRLMDSSSSQLEYQYRSVAIFPDCTGYAVGSIEGRSTIKYFNEVHPSSDIKLISFAKCQLSL
jgi:hypothetical protein